MKPSGGLPVNTSSAEGRNTCAEKVSAMASRSRWRCIQPLGRPVVPEVNAMSATSSAAVSTARYGPEPECAAASRVRSAGPFPPNSVTRRPVTPASARSAVDRASHRAWPIRASEQMVASSLARACASTVTAIAPAFMTASQQAASQGVVGPRSSTRLPGTTPRSSVSTWATRSTVSRSSP